MKNTDQEINRLLGRRLQSLRQSQRIRIGTLAEWSGFSPSSLQNYEAGARQPSLAGLEKLAKLLGCSPAWLATFSQDQIDSEENLYHLVNKPEPNQPPEAADSVMYSLHHIQAAGCIASQTKLGKATDNLLSPDLQAGDELLIDTSKTTVEGADIYCIRDKNGRETFRFARREFGRDGFTLYANNDAHFPPVFIEEGNDAVKIVGRVINITRWR